METQFKLVPRRLNFFSEALYSQLKEKIKKGMLKYVQF